MSKALLAASMMTLPPNPDVQGFLDDNEGAYLHTLAEQAATEGPILEVGSWCGRSTIWLAAAAQRHQTVVFALDHHRGSEEHQPGEMFHDSHLIDDTGRVDTFSAFRRNIASSGLDDWVVPIVTSSETLARFWQTPLGMLFIDGGHSLDAALTDWRGFAQWLRPGGILAIHDVFSDASAGGQAPFTIWRMAKESGLFESVGQQGSLRALRRLGCHK